MAFTDPKTNANPKLIIKGNMNKKDICIISLGCAKNTVDSESMGQLLRQEGYRLVDNPKRAGVVIVNTCGFIGDARDESYTILEELAAEKKKDQLLVAAGCLTQRYREAVSQRIPGIDGILGTRRWMDIAQVVRTLQEQRPVKTLYHLPDEEASGGEVAGIPRSARQGGSAYIKIADGCRRMCAFCAIPLIKGGPVSRTMEAIIQDANLLHRAGVKELVLIAQDTTDYGSDIGISDGLAKLLVRLTDEVPEIPWIRVMYAYPGYVTDHLIEVMASRKQILHYLDIPLQHGHPDTLKRMNRPHNVDWVRRTVAKMRSAMPDLAIRSTFIVGYPGETEAEFQALLDLVEELKLDHAGAFPFSFEPGTSSEVLGDPISTEVKQLRLEKLMKLQERISLNRNQALVGQVMQVLVEGAGDGVTLGRSFRDAPEIDGLVICDGQADVGQFIDVKITGAMAHDLTGNWMR
jgi:ribosomal protein S12 methylthiotransferase